jgi:hypothetical protein
VYCHDCRRRRLAIVQARQQAVEARAAAEVEAAARAAAADEAAVDRAVADAASDMSGEESAAYVSAGDGGASDGDSEDGSGDGVGDVQYASELHRQMAALQGDPSELEEAAQQQLMEFKEQVQAVGCFGLLHMLGLVVHIVGSGSCLKACFVLNLNEYRTPFSFPAAGQAAAARAAAPQTAAGGGGRCRVAGGARQAAAAGSSGLPGACCARLWRCAHPAGQVQTLPELDCLLDMQSCWVGIWLCSQLPRCVPQLRAGCRHCVLADS